MTTSMIEAMTLSIDKTKHQQEKQLEVLILETKAGHDGL